MSLVRRSFTAVAVLVAAFTVVGFAGNGSADAAGSTQWVAKAYCPQATTGHMACQAMHLVAIHIAGNTTSSASIERAATVTGGPAGGYTPAELGVAYGVNPAATTTQTVAIVDAYDDPTVLADLNSFDAHYGLPAETSTSFREVNQAGATSPLPVADPGWAGEITLDVQTVRGMCQKCKIILVEANTNNDSDLGAAENEAVALGAKIVSNSFGGPEVPGAVATDADYNHHGVAIIASTGDHGWYGWDALNAGGVSAGVPNTPATLNSVIAVGGTSLYLNSDSTRASETVWNGDGPSDAIGHTLNRSLGASGGGCSSKYTPQLWQADVAGYGSLGCGTLRSGVDIAADADPFTGYDVFATYPTSANWSTVGGTSLAAPLVAAMWALAGGPGSITYPALSLYGHFKGDTTKHDYDVRVGGNGLCDTSTTNACFNATQGNPNVLGYGLVDCGWGVSGTALLANHNQCYAAGGYDGVSGVGTPAGATLFTPDAPTASIAAPGTVTHNVTHTFSASGSSDPFPGGSIVKYVWSWGDGTSTTTTSLTTTHKYAAAATRTITLTVTDNYAGQGVKSTAKTLTITVH